MPKKVILYGDALKLLNTVVTYGCLFPDTLSEALDYDPQSFLFRMQQLRDQLAAGVRLEWDMLDNELDCIQKEKEMEW